MDPQHCSAMYFSGLEDHQGLAASRRGQEDPVPYQGDHGRVRRRPEPFRG